MKLIYEMKKENDKFCLYEVFIDGFFDAHKNKIADFTDEETANKKLNGLNVAKSMLEQLSRLSDEVENQRQLAQVISNYCKAVSK